MHILNFYSHILNINFYDYRDFMMTVANIYNFSFLRNVDFGDILTPEVKAAHKNTSYDLIANIVHDGEPNKGTYRVHVLKQGNSKWYEMQDLHVSDILPQMITLTEAYIQVTIIIKKNDDDY